MRGRGVLDFLMLGQARPAPQGALAYAPRAKLVPVVTLHGAYTRMPRATNALGLLPYLLPPAAAVPGTAYQAPSTNPLAPNPYVGAVPIGG